jgi:uncharacterized BrkB/YihY/UPF0761 family membrane protein
MKIERAALIAAAIMVALSWGFIYIPYNELGYKIAGAVIVLIILIAIFPLILYVCEKIYTIFNFRK